MDWQLTTVPHMLIPVEVSGVTHVLKVRHVVVRFGESEPYIPISPLETEV